MLLQSTGVEFPEVTTFWDGDKMRSVGAGVRAKKFAFVPVKVIILSTAQHLWTYRLYFLTAWHSRRRRGPVVLEVLIKEGVSSPVDESRDIVAGICDPFTVRPCYWQSRLTWIGQSGRCRVLEAVLYARWHAYADFLTLMHGL